MAGVARIGDKYRELSSSIGCWLGGDGLSPLISALGGDTNVSLGLSSKGVGYMALSTNGLNRLNIAGAGEVTISQNLVVSGTGNTTIAGNVGIGTVSPQSTLHVEGSQFRYAPSTGTGILFTGGTNYADIRAGLTSDFSTYKNLTLNAGGGNVGIGTTGPGV